MHVEARKEHRWLERLVGEWAYENESVMGPDQPPVKFTGTETFHSLGVWVIGEGTGDMPGGGTGRTVMTLGFDKGRFVGTFIGSMMTGMWVYSGHLDAAERVLTLDTEGPSFADPTKTAKYQDVIELVSDDHRTLTARYQGEDGQWVRFMTAHYRRVR